MGRITLKEVPDRFQELQKALKIDRHDLDTELIQQPELYHEAAAGYAASLSERDKAKLTQKNTEARLDKEIREKAEDDGEKVSNEAVKQRIQDHDDMEWANEGFIVAENRVREWEALKESFTQRGYALKDLVALFCAGYYAQTTGAGARRDATIRDRDRDRDTLDNERRRRGPTRED